jgi:ABC-type phosphate transport system ATPase subunit
MKFSPRGVGKSTLIRSLVKMYSGQNIVDIKGPITVAAGQFIYLLILLLIIKIQSLHFKLALFLFNIILIVILDNIATLL